VFARWKRWPGWPANRTAIGRNVRARASAQFIRAWNDGLPTDADRDRLIKPLLPDLIGTRASAATTRSPGRPGVAKWSTTFVTPATLTRAGFEAAAERLKTDPSLENLRAIEEKCARRP
jgi:hypothetical protein